MMKRTISGDQQVQIYCPRNTRKDAKISKTKVGCFMFSRQQALVLQSWIMTGINQQTQFAAGGGNDSSKLSRGAHQ